MIRKSLRNSALGRHGQSVLILLLLLLALPFRVAAEERNLIRSITTVKDPAGGTDWVELELSSSREFTVRNAVIILHFVGPQGSIECQKSRSPKDGSLNTLFFSLPAPVFDQAATGDQVRVDFGGLAGKPWKFPPLDKSLRDKK